MRACRLANWRHIQRCCTSLRMNFKALIQRHTLTPVMYSSEHVRNECIFLYKGQRRLSILPVRLWLCTSVRCQSLSGELAEMRSTVSLTIRCQVASSSHAVAMWPHHNLCSRLKPKRLSLCRLSHRHSHYHWDWKHIILLIKIDHNNMVIAHFFICKTTQMV